MESMKCTGNVILVLTFYRTARPVANLKTYDGGRHRETASSALFAEKNVMRCDANDASDGRSSSVIELHRASSIARDVVEGLMRHVSTTFAPRATSA